VKEDFNNHNKFNKFLIRHDWQNIKFEKSAKNYVNKENE